MTSSLENVRLHLVDSVDECFDLMRWLSTRDVIAFDTETTGFSIEQDHVRMVQVGWLDEAWAIPWHDWKGVFKDIVRRYEGEYVAHNMTFDVAHLDDEGVHIPRHRVHDTQIQCHVLDGSQLTGLKPLSDRYVDRRASAMQRQLDEAISKRGGWTWATVPIDYAPYWQYAALDTVLTANLDVQFRPQVLTNAPNAYQLERSVAWVYNDMERRGARVDRPFVERKIIDFQSYVIDVANWCVSTFGVKPGSNAKIVEILQSFGFVFTKATASGAMALDKEVLAEIDHPLAQAVLTRRQIQKIVSTYLQNFMRMSERDGFLHPSINSLGARTSRTSMAEPNLQNLPRKGTSAAADTVRDAIIARDGHTLVLCDFDQIEARMLAALSKDPGFIAAFNEGDFFTNVARELYHDDTIVKSDPRRQKTKNFVYARGYGAGAQKAAWTAGLDPQEVTAFLGAMDARFPGMRGFQDEIARVARQRQESEGQAYVRSPLTGRRHVADPGKEYALVNYLIQGTAAEVHKMKLCELSLAGMGKWMILPVHDEIISDVPNENIAEANGTLEAVMNDNTLFAVPLTASISHARSWGSAEK